jgi:hypothetical protein
MTVRHRDNAPSGIWLVLGVPLLIVFATLLFIWANTGPGVAPRTGVSQQAESVAKTPADEAPNGSGH